MRQGGNNLMRKEVKVTCSKLWSRTSPGTNSPQASLLYEGQVLIAVEEKKLSDGSIWFKFESTGNWSCYKGASGTYYMTIVKDLGGSSSTAEPVISHSYGYSDAIDAKVMDMLYANSTKYDSLDVSTRLFGSPHQFLSTADCRVNKKVDLGRKFIENIVAESPIVYFIPGRPNFLPNTSKSRKNVLEKFFKNHNVSDKTAAAALKDVLNTGGEGTEERYFDFVSDFANYMRIVNILCRVSSIYLGIGDQKAPGTNTKYKFYNWENYKYFNLTKEKEPTNKSVFSKVVEEVRTDVEEQLFGRGLYIPFYVDPSTSFSESASNSTRNSALEGFFDSAEGIMKDASFLLNAAAMSKADDLMKNLSEDIDKLSESIFKGSDNILTRFFGAANSVVQGHNIIFPEIWGDAAYNKSYSVTMNLVSPYGDKESIFLNVIVPLMHILAMALPQQVSANTYKSPMLVKAFSKGWFSCDMGIIESISIEKGGQGDAWSVDGLPMQVKVQISVKDLYSELSVPNSGSPAAFMQNQGMIDFLAVTCGVDITEPTFILKIKTMFAIFLDKIFDIPQNVYQEVLEDLRNILEPWINI